MLKLKEMGWEDNWMDYIAYGSTKVSETTRWNYRNHMKLFMVQILSVMDQLKNKMQGKKDGKQSN